METTTLKLYSLDYTRMKTYLIASLFILGNILFPQLCHLVSKGGFIFLPIYFFTLIGAYKYGWKVGVLTAVLSPVINYLLFGMPMLAVLPVLLTKSLFLALAAAYAAHHFQRISIPILILVVLSYQVVGTLAEWALVGNFFNAVQDFRIGLPGMLIQIFGGYLVIHYLLQK